MDIQKIREFIFRRSAESNAWKRALLDERGKLSPDGKTILRSLMRSARYFDVGYVAGDHDRTLILAVRRETVNKILRLLNFDESQVYEAMTEND